ncbi:MAG: tetratricopeptide repeat protein [Bacteroidetes bacterium]|nr:tetratricopeptide repeat protein [Bacteroidota bacterium]
MIRQLSEGLSIRKTIIYLLVLVLVTTITYSNHFGNSFHFDDSHTIQNNLYIQDVKNIPLFFKDGSTFSSLPSNQSYRPLVSASLAIDYWMGNGFNLFYFHLSSFILYLLQGILMFFLLFRLFERAYKNDWNFFIAYAATAWYLLHPANAETINYIIARSDLQSTFFVILGFVLYIFSPFCKKTFLYLIPVGIGALAKPPAVMFAPMLFFYILLFEQGLSLMDAFRQQHFPKVWQAIKAVIPAFAFCAAMYLLIDHFTPPSWQSGGTSRFHFMITQPFVILHYFITFFLPFGLSADTDWTPLDSIMDLRFFAGCAFIACMIFIAFLFSRDARLRPVSFGIAWFFLALIPSSSIIPFAEVLNDHRIFFPYVGLVISVSWVAGLALLKYRKHAASLKKYSIATGVAVMVLLSGYAYGAYSRNKVWSTEETLWKDVTIKSPKNGRGLMNYGLSQMSEGNYKDAESYFLKALQMWPTYSFLYINMGVLKEATGDKVSAENYLKSAMQYGPGYPDTWYFYSRFLVNQGRYAEAIPMLTKVIELSPAHIGAHELLMKAYSDTGDWQKLRELAESTLQINPGNQNALSYLDASGNKAANAAAPQVSEEEVKKSPSAEKYLNLSLAYYQSADYNKCIEAAAEALKLKPDYPEAYNNIGSSYNMLKQYDKAIGACQKALELKPDYTLAKNNLLLALNNREALAIAEKAAKEKPTAEGYLDLSLKYYQQGLYEKCIEACGNALKLKPDYADAYSNMGASYNQLKQWDKAIEACNKALAINPQHKLAKGNLNWAKDEKGKQ